MDSLSGNCRIESRAGEIERLRIQGEAIGPECLAMLGMIGVGAADYLPSTDEWLRGTGLRMGLISAEESTGGLCGAAGLGTEEERLVSSG